VSAAEIQFGDVDLLIREPEGEPEGALILNHGRGADEHDLHGVLDLLDPERRLLGVTTGGPLRLPPGGRHWYAVERVGYPEPTTFAGGYKRLSERIDGLLAERGIGWQRAIVGGFSQGAVMSYSLGLGAGRPIPAAIIALSGFIPEVDTWTAELQPRTALPVYIHHGAADPIITVDFGRRAQERLQAAGLAVEYLETDAGHSLPVEVTTGLQCFLDAVFARLGAAT